MRPGFEVGEFALPRGIDPFASLKHDVFQTATEKTLVMEYGTVIPLADVVSITGEIFCCP